MMRIKRIYPFLALLAGFPALASFEDDLVRADRVVFDLENRAEELDHRVAPGRAYLNNADAVRQFEDSLFQLLVEDFRPASEGFFILVTTGALRDSDLHRDAEWHLAESLYGMGNLVAAEARFKAVANIADHPFRDDAVRRLLELYATSDQSSSFRSLYDAEIVTGKVQPTGIATYTIGKSFYQQGDFDTAAGFFARLVESDSHFSRGKYFLGVIELRRGNPAAAIPYFRAASVASVKTTDQRKTQDLAQLAIARIAYEQSRFDDASSAYQTVGGDSEYLSDVLYEQVWNFIKQNRYDEALRAVDLFLLAFPEHRYAGELQVVQGHLYMGCGQQPDRCPEPDLNEFEGDAFERALSSYEKIVESYEPIRDRFGSMAASDDALSDYFDRVLSADSFADEGLPTFAISMVRSDPEVSAALDIHQTLAHQEEDLAASEALVAELERRFQGEVSMGGYETTRYQALNAHDRAVDYHVDLVDLELRWLIDENVKSADGLGADLTQLREFATQSSLAVRSNFAAKSRISEENAGYVRQLRELESVISAGEAEVASIRNDLEALPASDSRRADVQSDLDAIEQRLAAEREQASSIEARIRAAETTESDDGLEKFEQALSGIRTKMKGMRPSGSVGASVDALQNRLLTARQSYVGVLDRLDPLAAAEMARVRARFEQEALAVKAERADIGGVAAESNRVATALTRQGFERMEDFFADGVLKAEMGIIDVYWARKLEIADQRQRFQEERNALVEELERRFAVIRQKMEQ